MKKALRRRDFMDAAAAAAMGAGYIGCARPEKLHSGPPENSRVAILPTASYSLDLLDRLTRGARLCGLEAKGKRVLLKPNLVEFEASTAINTHASIIAAAIELFERLGASEILIGEGPGHRRDAIYLASEAGYRTGIPRFDHRFVDLNRDDVSAVRRFADLPEIFLPNTALRADLIVSVAKMKTHHWAGATLSMKNFFGLVPGSVYGWPKNQLHYIGIDRSIAELYRIFPRSFAIVDGVIGMEGNGPVQGEPKACGAIVMGSDLVAVDATCCRLMRIDPERIGYLRLASHLGHLQQARIEQCGEPVSSVQTEFKLIETFQSIRLA